MANKDFKSLDEQLSILKSRGLHIPDEIAAKDFLLRNNYYRVSGYSLTLRDHDIFSQSATFQNIMDIYEFDHELRHILMKYIEIIEVTIKSIYAYEFITVFQNTGKMYFDLQKKMIILRLTSPASWKRRNTAGGLMTGTEESVPVFHHKTESGK